MSYDPEARRDTPLALKLKERIRRDGPMSIHEYMTACLLDEEHGYYRARRVIGAAGDFITAPEISQVFGEIIGLWAAVAWQQMGAPANFRLLELGPGRGTMMADVIRAARAAPQFLRAVEVHLVETNPVLRAQQSATLRHSVERLFWHDELQAVPVGMPTVLIANEFLDTHRIIQMVRASDDWHMRVVEVDESDRLTFGVGARMPAQSDLGEPWKSAAVGSVCETPIFIETLQDVLKLAEASPLVALWIDYGHTSTMLGDTLQATRQHRFEHPLTSPGEADLTCQVDFGALIDQLAGGCSAEAVGLAVDGPTTQAEFLGRLGIVERASRLMSANPAKAASIEAGVARLLAVPGMGDRFKVIGMRSPQLPPLPGF